MSDRNALIEAARAMGILAPEPTPEDIESIRTACQRHTPEPEGYIARAEWAERMMKTHRQIQCERCGLWAVWIPKEKPATVVRQAQEPK